MTDQEQEAEQKRFRDQAALDLGAINELRRNGAFQNYWMRRLVSRRDEIAKKFAEGDPIKDGVTHEEREILRRIMLELNVLVGLLDRDEGEARASLDRTA